LNTEAETESRHPAPPKDPQRSVHVSVQWLSKSFPGTRALRNVSIDFRHGEIHSLVGGNGSGKSTLIKILTGVHHGDPGGLIRFGEQEVPADALTPELSRQAGVRVVHQDLGVFLDLSVTDNLAMGSGYARNRASSVNWRAMRRRTLALLDRFEINASPDTELRALGEGVRTQIAIARAFQDQGTGDSRGLLILDEPTASLSAREVDMLLAQLKRYAAAGQSILYVSHRLEEILSISDRVSALRDGDLVGTQDANSLSEELLIELIVGSQVEQLPKAEAGAVKDQTILRASHVSAGPLRDVSLEVRPGEIVGLAGLLGSGRSEFLRVVFGDLALASGSLLLDGTPCEPKRPTDAIEAGVAYVPEDRIHEAVFLDATVAENMGTPSLRSYWKRGHFAQGLMNTDARDGIKEFLVKAAGPEALLANLSGGNQQKVIMARWLRLKPRLLLLDEPTHGVDVGARAEIYQLLRDATNTGAAAIVVASDFEELAAISDRVLVLRDGRIRGEVTGDDVAAHLLTQLVHTTNR
jgi:ribose transport system ATP-binding protein